MENKLTGSQQIGSTFDGIFTEEFKNAQLNLLFTSYILNSKNSKETVTLFLNSWTERCQRLIISELSKLEKIMGEEEYNIFAREIEKDGLSVHSLAEKILLIKEQNYSKFFSEVVTDCEEIKKHQLEIQELNKKIEKKEKKI